MCIGAVRAKHVQKTPDALQVRRSAPDRAPKPCPENRHSNHAVPQQETPWAIPQSAATGGCSTRKKGDCAGSKRTTTNHSHHTLSSPPPPPPPPVRATLKFHILTEITPPLAALPRVVCARREKTQAVTTAS